MAVSRMVEFIPSHIRLQLSRLLNQARRMAPTTPMAPASVGVTSPRTMVPSTTKISARLGTVPRMMVFHSGQPRSVRASGGSAGTSAGRMIDRMNTQPMNSRTWTIEAPVAPIYISPGERCSWSARTISTSEGGISWVMVPEAAMTPVAWRTL